MKNILQLSLAVLALAGSHASAQLVNLDETGAAPTGTVVLASGTGGNGTYNGLTTGALLNSSGGASGISASVGGYPNYTDAGGTAITPGDDNLLASYLYNYSGPITVTFTGLIVGEHFDLVGYGSGDGQGQGSSFALTNGLQTFGPLLTTGNDRLISGGIGDAYQEFSGTLTSGTLTLSVSANTLASILDGVQLRESPLAPEPSTDALMGLGLGLLVLVVRKRRSLAS